MGGIVGGVLAGNAQKKAAKTAAQAQENAANRQIEYQEKIYADQTKRFSPYLDSGTNALAAYNFEMGLGNRPMIGATAPQIESFVVPGTPATGPARSTRPMNRPSDQRGDSSWLNQTPGVAATPDTTRYRVGGQEFATREEAQAYADANRTGGTEYQGFKATPGYEFRRQQGIDAIDASAAARGGLMSGRTLQDLTTFGDGIASQEYGNYMQRLAGLTDMGMGAAGMQATAGNNAAAGVNNALANVGNAQAAGAIGAGNATAGMYNNLAGAFGYMNQPGGMNGNGAWANGLFGGKGLGGFV